MSIDMILDTLNEIEGIAFVLDAWKDKAPDDYGVVELTGEVRTQWADNRMVEQEFRCRVHLYVTDGEMEWIRKVQEKLDRMELYYTMPAREYLFDIHKVHWSWEFWLDGPVEADGDG